jgi:ketosteroid isomerase-like protein
VSEENVVNARRGVDAFNKRDVDEFAELVTTDFEWYPATPEAVEGGCYRGREGIEAYFAEVGTTWREFRIVGDDFRDLGGCILVLGRLEASGRSSGVQIDSPLGLILDMRGHKGYRARGYLSHDSALKAVGLED